MTETCKKHHLLFKKNSSGNYQASDVWCGQTVNETTWYCSNECSVRAGNKIEKILEDKKHKLSLR